MADPITTQHNIDLRLLGSFSLSINGKPLPPLRTRKGQWLLALLALRPGRPSDRSWIAGMLWPDSLEEQSLCNLRRALTDLRSALGPASNRITAPTPRSLALEMCAGDSVDIYRFQQLAERTDTAALEAAIDCYRGPLLEGCDEHWVYQERLAVELAYLTALEALACRYCEENSFELAVGALKAVITIDPLRESAQRGLMRAHAGGGNLSAAVLAYRQFRVMLSRELNSDPDPETTELYQQLRRTVDQAPVCHPAVASANNKVSLPDPGAASRLPRPLTELIGRNAEIVSLLQAIGDHRLITLVGAGGIGKTRLSIELANTAQHLFADGAWFADLSGVVSPEMLTSFVATTFDIPENAAETPIDRLVQYLANKELLLVLDNCEHLLASCAALAHALLTACPHLKILATSREAMGINGEHRWAVPALSTPAANGDTKDLVDPDSLLQYDSIRLFVERGKGLRPDFALTPRNAANVAEICTRLDGIPLAIELAAARLNVLTADQIASRLKDRFRLLTGGSRTAWPRHQTLLALIDWSHDLLTDVERALLRRLAVFSGGWTLDDLESVACIKDGDKGHDDTNEQLDVFTSLLEKSLVQADAEVDGERRYRMLETIREFALERLISAGEWNELCRRHARYFLSLAEEGYAGIITVDREVWIRRLISAHDNMRSALTWSLSEEGESETAMRFANALGRFWYSQNLFREGLRWFEQVLAANRQLDPPALCRAYNGAGSMCWAMGDYDAAQRYYELHLSIRRAQDDPMGLGTALQNLGLVAMHRGEYSRARSMLEESVDLIRKHGDRALLAAPLNNLAIVAKDMGELDFAYQLLMESYELYLELQNRSGTASVLIARGNLERRLGKREAARSSLLESLALYKAQRELQGCSIALHNLGEMSQQDGDLITARRYYLESLDISRQIADRRQSATTLCNLAQLTREEGNLEEYRSLYRQSADLAIDMKERTLILSMLMDLAAQALLNGNPAAIPRLAGAVNAAVELFGTPMNNGQKESLDRLTKAARELLSEEAYCAGFSEGRSMPLEQALNSVLGP